MSKYTRCAEFLVSLTQCSSNESVTSAPLSQETGCIYACYIPEVTCFEAIFDRIPFSGLQHATGARGTATLARQPLSRLRTQTSSCSVSRIQSTPVPSEHHFGLHSLMIALFPTPDAPLRPRIRLQDSPQTYEHTISTVTLP
ncbi:putative membrane protein [Fusarium oxysporum f. sp. albedinis]|nr:putative membrane protein [Fusarium oxysporum f. sp. albedinis]